MKSFLSLFSCLVIVAATSNAFAAAPSTNAPPVTPPPVKAQKAGAPTEVKASPAAPKPVESKFDDYLKELGDALKLTDDEKKDIQTYYVADAGLLKNILNNDALSPLQQARQVSDLREARNVKIAARLQDADRQHTFLKVEAKYRVALTELAANGGLVLTEPPPTAPAPAVVAPTPGQAEKTPKAKSAAK